MKVDVNRRVVSQVAVAVFGVMAILLASSIPASADTSDYYSDEYFEGDGSGGSHRCAVSSYAITRFTPSQVVKGNAGVEARKDTYCQNFNPIPSNGLRIHAVLQEYSFMYGLWVTRVENYESNSVQAAQLDAFMDCGTSGSCATFTRLASSYTVNTLGADRNDFRVSHMQ